MFENNPMFANANPMMAGNGNGQDKPRCLAIVAAQGSLDMAYPPLILANAARMSGIDAHIFYTFWGLDVITKKKMKKLRVATVGNPNMHPWFNMPTWMGAIPGISSAASWMMRREIAKLDFPPVDEFIQLVMDAGTCVYACKMSVDMMKLAEDDFMDGVQILGAMEFLEITEGAQVMFV